MSELKAGTRLKSAVCDTQVMVISAPAAEASIACGGAEMVAMDADTDAAAAPAAGADAGTALGKRYVSGEGDIELLCTKPGKGSLAVNGEALVVKEAKALPSSD